MADASDEKLRQLRLMLGNAEAKAASLDEAWRAETARADVAEAERDRLRAELEAARAVVVAARRVRDAHREGREAVREAVHDLVDVDLARYDAARDKEGT